MPLVPSKVIVPPLALKVTPVLIVSEFANVAVPDGAVKTAPELSVTAALASKVVYEPKLVVVLIVTAPEFTKPLKPLSDAPEFIVRPETVSVPDPVIAPATINVPVVVGFVPSGNVQLLEIVLLPAVFAIVTRLKLALLQLTVMLEVPSKVSVPPFALKAPVPDIVNAPATVMTPLDAVKLPALRAKLLFKSSVWLAAVKLPAAWLKAPLMVSDLAMVMVPV